MNRSVAPCQVDQCLVAAEQKSGGAPNAVGQTTQKHVMVPNGAVGGIIGRGGATIKVLIAECGCHIQLQRKEEMQQGGEERRLTLTGTAEQIAIAERRIQAIIQQMPGFALGFKPAPGTVTSAMKVPNRCGAPIAAADC